MFYLVFECEIEWWNEDIEFKRTSGVRIDHPCLLPCIDNHIHSLFNESISNTFAFVGGKTDRKEGLDSKFKATLLSESALHGEHLVPFEMRIFAFQQFNKLCFVFDQHFGKAHFVCVSQGDCEPILWLRETWISLGDGRRNKPVESPAFVRSDSTKYPRVWAFLLYLRNVSDEECGRDDSQKTRSSEIDKISKN